MSDREQGSRSINSPLAVMTATTPRDSHYNRPPHLCPPAFSIGHPRWIQRQSLEAKGGERRQMRRLLTTLGERTREESLGTFGRIYFYPSKDGTGCEGRIKGVGRTTKRGKVWHIPGLRKWTRGPPDLRASSDVHA